MNEPVKVPWSGWKITKVLGSGSFGSVYEIQRNVLGTITKAAMKVISVPRDTADLNDLISIGYDKESINARFLDELKGISNEYNMMDQLKGNANIIYCEDLYYEEKPDGYGYDLYIRMELLEPLIKAIPNPATEDQVIKLGIDMCNALSACKKHKIIHRDIKPSNILISKDGNFKLGDFGVSKTSERTAGGTKTGTYGFMAPEVYNNKPYNASVDIYSLGMVLYWMLNRRCGPFLPLPPTIPMAHQIDEAKQRRFNGEPIPAPIDGSDELKAVVLKACAFDPDERYSSPEELSAELEKLKYSSTVSNNDTISSLRLQQSTSQYESSYDERTMGNNWGYTDEPTQGTQYGGEEIEQGGTVGRNYSEPKPVRESKKKNRSTNVQQPAASKSPEKPISIQSGDTEIRSPFPGTVSKVLLNYGDKVSPGDVIIKMDALKMSNDIVASEKGVLTTVCPSIGTKLNAGDIITTIRSDSNEKKISASAGSKFDVIKTVTLNENEAAEGTYKSINIDGKKLKLHIPSGVNNDGVLKFDGQGKTDPETGAKGALLLKVIVKSEEKKPDFWDNASPEDQCTDEVVVSNMELRYLSTCYTVNHIQIPIPNNINDGDIINGIRFHIHDPYEFLKKPESLKNGDLQLLENLPSAVLFSEYMYPIAFKGNKKVMITGVILLIISIIICAFNIDPLILLGSFTFIGFFCCAIGTLIDTPRYLKSKKNAASIRETTIRILRDRGIDPHDPSTLRGKK